MITPKVITPKFQSNLIFLNNVFICLASYIQCIKSFFFVALLIDTNLSKPETSIKIMQISKLVFEKNSKYHTMIKQNSKYYKLTKNKIFNF